MFYLHIFLCFLYNFIEFYAIYSFFDRTKDFKKIISSTTLIGIVKYHTCFIWIYLLKIVGQLNFGFIGIMKCHDSYFIFDYDEKIYISFGLL